VKLGLDLGSTMIKAVLLSSENNVIKTAQAPTAYNPKDTALNLIQQLNANNIPTIATGYGRALSGFKTITEITCHAKGASLFNPHIKSLIDIGGQDSKVIRIGENGSVDDFAMNDRCAAGTGSFLSAIAAKVGLTPEQLSDIQIENPKEISSTCIVFAESEVISYISAGIPREHVLSGILMSVARRITGLARQTNAKGPFGMSGGGALYKSLINALSIELGEEVYCCSYPQFAGAIGAAIYAKD